MTTGEWAPEIELILAATYFRGDPHASRERLANAVESYRQEVLPVPGAPTYLDRLAIAAENCVKAARADTALAVEALGEILHEATREYRRAHPTRRDLWAGRADLA